MVLGGTPMQTLGAGPPGRGLFPQPWRPAAVAAAASTNDASARAAHVRTLKPGHRPLSTLIERPVNKTQLHRVDRDIHARGNTL